MNSISSLCGRIAALFFVAAALAAAGADDFKLEPGFINEIEVTVKDGVAHCTCNGEVLEAALKVPPTGGIGLEADRGQMEYRRIRLKELP